MSFCEGKERFTTFAFAERVAKLSGRRNERVRLQAYRCQCGAYHVGSTAGGARPRNKVRGESYLTALERETA